MADQSLEQIIIKSLNEGVVTIECNGLISSINPSGIRILNLFQEPVVGKSFNALVPQREANDPFFDVFEALIKKGEFTLHKEIDVICHNGQMIQVSMSSAALNANECILGTENYVILFRDITAFKNLETAKLKAIDHLSHELKTPLSILKASIESISKVYESNSRASKLVSRAYRNLERLFSIQASVEQIFSPPKLCPQTFIIPEAILNTLNKILGEARRRQVRLEPKFQYVGEILFDPDILELILTTLVKNAIENTPDQGLIEVIFSKPGPLNFQLSVHDYGVGIPPADLEFIFQGFHHTQNTDEYSTKKPFDFNAGGKGMELLQLKNLAELHGFKLFFESERCGFLTEPANNCSGRIDSCPYVDDVDMCLRSGYSIFGVEFTNISG
ncbi:MAG: ATP-binding protein [Desulfomonilaceae bacterium]